MECVHVAHDCVVGNGCIIGNSTKFAGEVVIDDNAVISGAVLVHQFCHLGSYIMIQGGTRVPQDVPPFVMIGREPARFCGLNLVGLRRRGFERETIDQIHEAYRIYYSKGLRSEAIAEIKERLPLSKEIQYIIDFIEASERGIVK